MITIILKLIIAAEIVAISYFVIKTLSICWPYWFPPKTVVETKPLSQKSIDILKNLKETPYVG